MGHISEMAEVLLHVYEVMKDVPDDAYFAVRELMIAPTWKYCHLAPENLKHAHLPDPISEEVFHIAGTLQFW